jgi:hypothetical protein
MDEYVKRFEDILNNASDRDSKDVNKLKLQTTYVKKKDKDYYSDRIYDIICYTHVIIEEIYSNRHNKKNLISDCIRAAMGFAIRMLQRKDPHIIEIKYFKGFCDYFQIAISLFHEQYMKNKKEIADSKEFYNDELSKSNHVEIHNKAYEIMSGKYDEFVQEAKKTKSDKRSLLPSDDEKKERSQIIKVYTINYKKF